jgi:hypothetical protein
MIQYDKDGATVFYIDDKASKISAGPTDPDKYMALLTIMDAQIAAVTENKTAADLYTQAVKNAQISVDAGRPAPELPVKPKQKIVADTGAVSYVPFAPPLPDIVNHDENTIASQPFVAGVDKQAIMYAMITAIYRKMFPGG